MKSLHTFKEYHVHIGQSVESKKGLIGGYGDTESHSIVVRLLQNRQTSQRCETVTNEWEMSA